MLPSPSLLLARLSPLQPSALVLLVLNRLLARNPWARDRLQAFTGRRARLSVGGVAVVFVLTSDGRVEESRDPADTAVSLELPLSALPSLAEGPDALFRHARIAGEALFAENLGFVLRNLHWDFEEDLAALVGDPLAHRLHRLGVAAAAQARDVGQRLADNFADYLREEGGLGPSRNDFDAFRENLAELEKALQRSDKRLNRLEKPIS